MTVVNPMGIVGGGRLAEVYKDEPEHSAREDDQPGEEGEKYCVVWSILEH